MTLLEKAKVYRELGITCKVIANYAKLSEITVKRFCNGEKISDAAIEKIESAIIDIAAEIYGTAYNNGNTEEEWQD